MNGRRPGRRASSSATRKRRSSRVGAAVTASRSAARSGYALRTSASTRRAASLSSRSNARVSAARRASSRRCSGHPVFDAASISRDSGSRSLTMSSASLLSALARRAQPVGPRRRRTRTPPAAGSRRPGSRRTTSPGAAARRAAGSRRSAATRPTPWPSRRPARAPPPASPSRISSRARWNASDGYAGEDAGTARAAATSAASSAWPGVRRSIAATSHGVRCDAIVLRLPSGDRVVERVRRLGAHRVDPVGQRIGGATSAGAAPLSSGASAAGSLRRNR